MKRLNWLAAAGVVGITLTGCTVNVGVPVEPDQPAPPVQTQPAVADDPEQAFLDLVKREAPLTYQDLSEKDLIQGGYFVCTAFDDGKTGREVAQSFYQAAEIVGNPGREGGAIVYAAVTILCPEHTDEMMHLD